MQKPDVADLIEVLACDIGARPKNAPSFEDLAPYIRSVLRDDRAVTVAFDNVALPKVEALVDAERQCCPDLTWDLEPEPHLRLRIGAAPAQLDVLEQMLALPS
jgi:hypothetical protein